ncbi:MAG: hypothetical protein ACQCN4_13445 [Candidatus Bathyarchaeia archaeon]|jgi:hypothetical protein
MSAEKKYELTPFGRWATQEERVERYKEKLTQEEQRFVLQQVPKELSKKDAIQLLKLMVKAGILVEA